MLLIYTVKLIVKNKIAPVAHMQKMIVVISGRKVFSPETTGKVWTVLSTSDGVVLLFVPWTNGFVGVTVDGAFTTGVIVSDVVAFSTKEGIGTSIVKSEGSLYSPIPIHRLNTKIVHTI
jgi:hypothetical protein